MAFLRRPSGRFLVSAAVLVAVAAATGAAGLSAWLIVAIELAAWVVVVLANRWVSGRLQAEASADRPVTPPVAVVPTVVAAVEVAPVAVVEPPLAEPPEEAGAPDEPPAPIVVEEPVPVVPAAATPPTGSPTRWNVWTLETVAKDNAADNDELGFLIVYLREFADSNGELPPGFDSLVRESFGDLLPSAG